MPRRRDDVTTVRPATPIPSCDECARPAWGRHHGRYLCDDHFVEAVLADEFQREADR